MNKTQIIELVAEKIETQSIKGITEVLNNFIEVVAELLADNQAALNPSMFPPYGALLKYIFSISFFV